MKVMQLSPNNYYQKTSFQGYTPTEICADLCKGACCNHGTSMSANLKIIADKFCASYHTMPENLKSAMLVKAPIIKWVVNSQNPTVQTLNKLANAHIDALSRETHPETIKELEQALSVLNKKLAELTNGSESFVAITNPELKNSSFMDVASNATNICMFKDHNQTNLCTIYNGVKSESGEIVGRPSPCLKFGGDELPCPWHKPEKYEDLYHNTKAMLEYNGYTGLPPKVIQQYIAEQYNLNRVFYEKIWLPYLEKGK